MLIQDNREQQPHSQSSVFEGAEADGVRFHLTLLQYVVGWNNLQTHTVKKSKVNLTDVV